MIVKLVESFLFTTGVPIVYGTYGGEERCLWSWWGNMKKETLGVLASQAYVVNSIGTHKEATWKTEA